MRVRLCLWTDRSLFKLYCVLSVCFFMSGGTGKTGLDAVYQTEILECHGI